MVNKTYLDKFENIIKVVEHAGGHIRTETSLVYTELKIMDPLITQCNCDDDQLEEARETVSSKYKAIAFLLSANRNRYGKLLRIWKTGLHRDK